MDGLSSYGVVVCKLHIYHVKPVPRLGVATVSGSYNTVLQQFPRRTTSATRQARFRSLH